MVWQGLESKAPVRVPAPPDGAALPDKRQKAVSDIHCAEEIGGKCLLRNLGVKPIKLNRALLTRTSSEMRVVAECLGEFSYACGVGNVEVSARDNCPRLSCYPLSGSAPLRVIASGEDDAEALGSKLPTGFDAKAAICASDKNGAMR